MAPTLPTPPATAADFKKRFARDFLFGAGMDTVTDADIANAMQDAVSTFNPALFSPAEGWKAFLLVSAHFLVVNIQAVGGLQAAPEGLGVENQAQGPIASKSVSGISVNYVEPPDRIKSSTVLMQFWITDYGRKYLAMLQPKLAGAVGAVRGPVDVDAQNSPDIPFSDY